MPAILILMVPGCVQNAIRILSEITEPKLDRETLTHFSMLDAFSHYYPTRHADGLSSCLERFNFIRVKEPSRLLKQRRIAMTKILRELATVLNS